MYMVGIFVCVLSTTDDCDDESGLGITVLVDCTCFSVKF